MMNENTNDWIHEGKPPFINDGTLFDVFVNGQQRKAKRVENNSKSLTPYMLIFTDCEGSSQNIICDEKTIDAWRLSCDS